MKDELNKCEIVDGKYRCMAEHVSDCNHKGRTGPLDECFHQWGTQAERLCINRNARTEAEQSEPFIMDEVNREQFKKFNVDTDAIKKHAGTINEFFNDEAGQPNGNKENS